MAEWYPCDEVPTFKTKFKKPNKRLTQIYFSQPWIKTLLVASLLG